MDNLTVPKTGANPLQSPAGRSVSPKFDATQLAGLLQVDEARLRLEQVEALAGFKRSAIYQRIRAGTFPAPVRSGTRCSRWVACEIRAWLASQK